MKSIIRLCIVILLASTRLHAQALHADSLFDRLIGRWVLRGTIARQSTTHDVTFAWMLGREYVQMHEVSREREANGTPSYEAVVLFGRDPKSGEYACLWLDNTAYSARSNRKVSAEEERPATRSPSCSTTRRQRVSIRPSSTVARRTRGSGTWIMTALGFAGRLPG